MSVTDIGAARWERVNDPAKCTPADALKAALRDVEGDAPSHVIICLAYECEDGGARGSWFQAGSYNSHAQLGLLERIKMDIIDTAV